MIVKTCQSRAELEVSRQLNPELSPAHTNQVALRHHMGRLRKGEVRIQPTEGVTYAIGITEAGDSNDASVINAIRRAALCHVIQDAAERDTDLYIAKERVRWAEDNDVALPTPHHALVPAMAITKPWRRHNEQDYLIARNPVTVANSPAGIALATALHNESRWTPTAEFGDWPTAELASIQWTNEEGQIGAIAGADTQHNVREVPERVESIRLTVTIGDQQITIRAQIFIDDHLRVSSTHAMNDQTDVAEAMLLAAAASPGRRADLTAETCAAVAMAHTMPKSQAYQRYIALVKEQHLDYQLRIIETEGNGQSPPSVKIEYDTSRHDIMAAAQAVREAAERLMDQTDSSPTGETDLEGALRDLKRVAGIA